MAVLVAVLLASCRRGHGYLLFGQDPHFEILRHARLVLPLDEARGRTLLILVALLSAWLFMCKVALVVEKFGGPVLALLAVVSRSIRFRLSPDNA